jgi:hypothetical protein
VEPCTFVAFEPILRSPRWTAMRGRILKICLGSLTKRHHHSQTLNDTYWLSHFHGCVHRPPFLPGILKKHCQFQIAHQTDPCGDRPMWRPTHVEGRSLSSRGLTASSIIPDVVSYPSQFYWQYTWLGHGLVQQEDLALTGTCAFSSHNLPTLPVELRK